MQAVRGDVLDSVVVEKAVAGHDAVLCAIGAGAGRTTLRDHVTPQLNRV